jgi:DNA-binding MarR family transcriptional regulator
MRVYTLKRNGLSNDMSEKERNPSRCTCTNIRRAARAVTKFYDRIMEPSGLKVTQFSILRNTMKSGPFNVSELAKLLNLDRTTLVRNLKPLVSDGFIKTMAGVDARSRKIIIAKKGRNAVKAALPYWEKAQAIIGKRLGQDGLNKFVSTLMEVESLIE